MCSFDLLFDRAFSFSFFSFFFFFLRSALCAVFLGFPPLKELPVDVGRQPGRALFGFFFVSFSESFFAGTLYTRNFIVPLAFVVHDTFTFSFVSVFRQSSTSSRTHTIITASYNRFLCVFNLIRLSCDGRSVSL